MKKLQKIPIGNHFNMADPDLACRKWILVSFFIVDVERNE